MKKRQVIPELSTIGALLFCVFLFEFVFFDFLHLNLRIPFLYTLDGLGSTAYVKNIIQNGWLADTDRLSAPFVFSITSFTPLLFINIAAAFYRFLGLFTADPVLIFNIRVLLAPVSNTLFAYYAFRKMRFQRMHASLGALCFGTCFFVQNRLGHIDFAYCEAVPLAMLMCYWCTQGEALFRWKRFYREKRFWEILLFSWIIANDGIGYYPFFSCFFLACIAVYSFFSTGKIRSVVSPIICIGGIVFFFALNFLPLLFSNAPDNHAAVRSSMESELYGLRIAGLYLPPEGFGIGKLKNLYSAYLRQSILINENTTGYLGMIGIAGSLILFLQLIQGKKRVFEKVIRMDEDVYWLSCLQVLGILFGTIAGFSMIFSLIVTPSIRAYNRISIYLQFIAIAGFLCFCRGIYAQSGKRKMISMILCITVTLMTFLDYHLVGPRYSSETNADEYMSDKAMFADLENSLEEGAMIFQLPYMPYPEAAPIRGMNHTYAMVPYLLSNELKWSHGSTSQAAIQWNSGVAECECAEMVDVLSLAGFSGILVDTRAYSGAELNELADELGSLTGSEPMVSANGSYRYYSLNVPRDYYRETLTAAQKQAAEQFALKRGRNGYGEVIRSVNGLNLMINEGVYGEEKNDQEIWRWIQKMASFSYFSDRDETVLFNLRIQKVTDAAKLHIRCGDTSETVDFAGIENELSVRIPVQKGENIITLEYEGGTLHSDTDPRELAYRIICDSPCSIMKISEYWTYYQ